MWRYTWRHSKFLQWSIIFQLKLCIYINLCIIFYYTICAGHAIHQPWCWYVLLIVSRFVHLHSYCTFFWHFWLHFNLHSVLQTIIIFWLLWSSIHTKMLKHILVIDRKSIICLIIRVNVYPLNCWPCTTSHEI